MNATNQPPTRAGIQFSYGWCIALVFVHAVMTIFIRGIYHTTGMGISTREAADFHFAFDLWGSVLWIWTPLAMAARSPDHLPNEKLILELAVLWSCFVGVVAGFAIPYFRKGLRRSSIAG